jgi:hypothetical protein
MARIDILLFQSAERELQWSSLDGVFQRRLYRGVAARPNQDAVLGPDVPPTAS